MVVEKLLELVKNSQIDLNHVHSTDCGHEIIYHDGHFDYIVEDTLHHVHNDHCD